MSVDPPNVSDAGALPHEPVDALFIPALPQDMQYEPDDAIPQGLGFILPSRYAPTLADVGYAEWSCHRDRS